MFACTGKHSYVPYLNEKTSIHQARRLHKVIIRCYILRKEHIALLFFLLSCRIKAISYYKVIDSMDLRNL